MDVGYLSLGRRLKVSIDVHDLTLKDQVTLFRDLGEHIGIWEGLSKSARSEVDERFRLVGLSIKEAAKRGVTL